MKAPKIQVEMPSSLYVTLSEPVFEDCYCNFDEAQWFNFNNFLSAGLHFPKIFQYIAVLAAIIIGHTNIERIVLYNLIPGVGMFIIWYLFRLYKVPGLSYISCTLGYNVFRIFLHFIPLIAISLFLLRSWRLLISCLVGAFVTQAVRMILYRILATTRYNDSVARYVTKFKP